MPHVPNVMPIEPKELLEFCSDAGYSCRLEPRGTWFTPPDYNVGMTDWERSLRLRCALPTLLQALSVWLLSPKVPSLSSASCYDAGCCLIRTTSATLGGSDFLASATLLKGWHGRGWESAV